MTKGISVSLNSDDPPFFETSVGQEYQNSAKNFKLSIEDLKNISLMAMKASFADSETKSKLIDKILKF
jgi:adenosine deaminase